MVDPLSINELRLAITASQTTKSSVLMFNLLADLAERVEVLEAEARSEPHASGELTKPAKRAPTKKVAATKDEKPEA